MTTVRPRVAEDALAKHRSDRGRGFTARETDDRALAGGEARGFHDQWLGMAIDVVEGGRRSVNVRLAAVGMPAACHHFLRERLGRLELGRRRARSEHRPSLGPEAIREPAGQRYLGTDHGEVDAVHVGRVGDAVQVVGRDGEVGRQVGGAGIAGRAVEIGVRVLAPERPAESVLPSASADDQQPHDFWAFRNASRARSAARLAASATWVASSRASPA